MNHTTNYNLPQWEDTDVVTREDVNGAMASIDTAIAGLPKLITGSYAGRGDIYTVDVSIGFRPKLVLLFNDGKGSAATYPLLAFITQNVAFSLFNDGSISIESSHYKLNAIGFSINHFTSTSVAASFNASGSTMYYIAFG